MNEEKERTITWYEHEDALMHYGRVNFRSMVTTIAVCVTFVIITAIFVIGYTVREKNWLETIANLKTPVIAEVQDGIHEQPDP